MIIREVKQNVKKVVDTSDNQSFSEFLTAMEISLLGFLFAVKRKKEDEE